tara:strand:+ start:987 stop:1694 length:708 start_codon:yes stop_codon:yes gene_type:complete
MGFLDNSTNNIIVDAVLTDYGRELLSQNNGSFTVDKFAFGDDEVDYGIIKKFGRTVGKEKIEKNTPIFEAQTNQNLALKHRIISLKTATYVKLPSYDVTGDVAGNTITFKRVSPGSTKSISLKQTVEGDSGIDQKLQDAVMLVKVPNKFIKLTGGASPISTDSDDISTYQVNASTSPSTTSLGSEFGISFSVKSIADSVYTYFGDANNKSQISSTIQIIGVSSGWSLDLAIKIEK